MKLKSEQQEYICLIGFFGNQVRVTWARCRVALCCQKNISTQNHGKGCKYIARSVYIILFKGESIFACVFSNSKNEDILMVVPLGLYLLSVRKVKELSSLSFRGCTLFSSSSFLFLFLFFVIGVWMEQKQFFLHQNKVWLSLFFFLFFKEGAVSQCAISLRNIKWLVTHYLSKANNHCKF